MEVGEEGGAAEEEDGVEDELGRGREGGAVGRVVEEDGGQEGEQRKMICCNTEWDDTQSCNAPSRNKPSSDKRETNKIGSEYRRESAS